MGYNPELVFSGNIDFRVRLIELGLFEYSKIKQKELPKSISLSLHLARTPITEDLKIQAEYLDKIEKVINTRDFSSIGLHLTGPRHLGIGQYGFSSHYLPTEEQENNAINFIFELQKKFKLPVWIENANFYSSNFNEIISEYASIEKITKITGCELIVDLSHIIISFANAKIPAAVAIKLINWSNVAEIHLSGVIKGTDGVLHDCHSAKVDTRVWDLFKQIYLLLPKNTFINLEHTDSALVKANVIDEDIARLYTIIDELQLPTHSHYDLNKYVTSHYMKLLKKWIPGLEEAFSEDNLDLQSEIQDWLNFCKYNNICLAIDEFELLLSEKNHVYFAPDHFLKYLKR